MQKFEVLKEFIDRAVKSRKYPESTGQALKVALNLFEGELKEEEKNSLDLVEKNINQIYQAVSKNTGTRFSAASLATYKSRVIKVINDYKKYGVDPTKMASWDAKFITRTKKHTTTASSATDPVDEKPIVGDASGNTSMHRIELALRPDVRFVVIVPRDINKGESKILKSVIDSLVSDSDDKK